MRLSKKAQSLIDASIILALVLAGILIMRPYVTRSLNALFKGYEGDIQQADQEKFKIAPPGRTPIGPCRCGPWTPPNLAPCGNGTSCPIGTREFNRSCVSCPPSMPRKQCRPDNTCCTNWTLFCSGGNYDCCGARVTGFAPYGNYPAAGGDSCADGYGRAWRRCGGNTSFRCEPSPYCDFLCTGGIGSPQNSSQCPGDQKRLAQKATPTVFAANNICSPLITGAPNPPVGSSPKCEQRCNSGYIQQGSSCVGCQIQTRRVRICVCSHDCRGDCSGRTISNCAHRALLMRPPWGLTQAWCPSGLVALTGSCEFIPGPYSDHKWPAAILTSRPVTSGGVSGWECQGRLAGGAWGGNNCAQQAFWETKVLCISPPSACPRPQYICRAIPVDHNGTFQNCGAGEWELLRYTSGDGGANHARVTICCNTNFLPPPSQRPSCRAIPRTVSQSYGSCNANEREWFRYCSGTCDGALDSRVTFCCNTNNFPQAQCRALNQANLSTIRSRSPRSTGSPFAEWGECWRHIGQDWYQMLRYCSGTCHWLGPYNDAKVTFCCRYP